MLQKRDCILVLDFGSQLTQLIARRLRELNFYSEVHPYSIDISEIKRLSPKGIILSGGPSSVYDEGAPQREIKDILQIAPILGICYGMQILAHKLGGKVTKASDREYGYSHVHWEKSWGSQIPSMQKVWMSHGDILENPPPGAHIVARSENQHPAAIEGERFWGVQFHPEVVHTEMGGEILNRFATDLCGMEPTWDAPHIIQDLKEKILSQVDEKDHVLVALSGGVDSTVVGTLLTQTLGADRVHCIFVDNGLLRKNEFTEVLKSYENLGLNITGIPAQSVFLNALKGLKDPEEKRKAIGKAFIDVFESHLPNEPQIKWLAQGTLYPDVIESVSFFGGPSHTIKSHHNVGGLPDKMKLKLLEPVRTLFKDEVRSLGLALGVPEALISRHPFPGPGLAIRVLGEVTEDKLDVVREADAIFISQLKKTNLYHKIWQAFCVLLPVQTVGVQGDGRTYEYVLSLRAVTSLDGMTADWYPFEFDFLRRVSNEITNKVKSVNRVVYDITSKPPATIEWE